MNILSRKVENIKSSLIRKMFDLASKNNGEFISFAIGQPHFEVPKKLKKSMINAIKNDFNVYAPTQGILELREIIAKKLNKENQIKAKSENVIVTSGVSGALFLVFASILNPGDEIIIPDPYFTLYKELVIFLEGTPVYLDTYPNFRIDSIQLEKLINSKTKALIINSPNNPTGIVLSKKELKDIADVAKKHNLLIISDEIYEKFDYEKKFFSIGSIYDNTVTLNGFSKNYAITGWRVGYAHGPNEIIQAMNKLQQYTFVCAPLPAQIALLNSWGSEPKKEYKSYKNKRDILYLKLKNKYEIYKPEGAFYVFIKIPKGHKDFINELIDKKVLVVPSEAFSVNKNYFRISFAVDDDELKKGITILNNLR
ncbi:MAG: pyridoxal phosphate-dependent aminotransferase [Patescibacteria group bacterium]|nr:pyridoxal phosphate-dependent aminotransferase [Patescibacteria group bacterium]